MRVVALLLAVRAQIADDGLFIIGAAWRKAVVAPPEERTWQTVVVLEGEQDEFDAMPDVRFSVLDDGENVLYSAGPLLSGALPPIVPGAPVLFRVVVPVTVMFERACIVKTVVLQGAVQLASTSFAVLTD